METSNFLQEAIYGLKTVFLCLIIRIAFSFVFRIIIQDTIMFPTREHEVPGHFAIFLVFILFSVDSVSFLLAL